MSGETVIRVLSSAPEIIERINSGIYTVWGGVIRITRGFDGAGQIVAHLQFPSDSQQASEAISSLQDALSGAGGVQESLDSLQNLQYANLALSGLNLAVSVAGFAIVCKKLNGISEQLNAQSDMLNQLLELAKDTKASDELRDFARFRSALKSIRQFAESGEIGMLKSQVTGLHEQYEFTKLTLFQAARDVTRKDYTESLDVLKTLQERMMYLAFLQSYVQQRIGAHQFAIEALHELQSDWLKINTVVVDAIAANQEWIEDLDQQSANEIISFLNYRKEVSPAVEYQSTLLEFAGRNPQAAQLLKDDVAEIRFLVA